MEDKLFKGLLIVTAGLISMKAVKAVQKYKAEVEEHAEILEDAEQD